MYCNTRRPRLKSDFCRICKGPGRHILARSEASARRLSAAGFRPGGCLLKGRAMRFHLAVVALALSSLGMCPVCQGQSTDGMAAFIMDRRSGFLSHSPVDVSFLLDAPAGKHGFIKVANGHLATGEGQRIRFWGVNITDWSHGSRQIPTKEDAPFI